MQIALPHCFNRLKQMLACGPTRSGPLSSERPHLAAHSISSCSSLLSTFTPPPSFVPVQVDNIIHLQHHKTGYEVICLKNAIHPKKLFDDLIPLGFSSKVLPVVVSVSASMQATKSQHIISPTDVHPRVGNCQMH